MIASISGVGFRDAGETATLSRVVRCACARLYGLAAGTVFVLQASVSAHAEVGIAGSMSAAKVEARDSSVAEILESLGTRFDVRYRSWADLNRPVDGTFEGPVVQIIQRLLKGYDHIVKSTAAGQIEIVVVKLSGKESEKIVGSNSVPTLHPATAPVNAQTSAYPDPRWRAISYSRGVPRKPSSLPAR